MGVMHTNTAQRYIAADGSRIVGAVNTIIMMIQTHPAAAECGEKSLNQCINNADEKMYQLKKARKAQRE